jgi:hypothetical protein
MDTSTTRPRPVREFGRDACGVVHVDGILLGHVNDMSAYVRYCELFIVFMKINYTDNVARVKGLFFPRRKRPSWKA